MIDWPHVAFNALWIVGCAVILAAFSHTHWLAHAQGIGTRQRLRTATFELPFAVGLCLISLGLFFLGRGWLERVVWAAFAILFAWQSWRVWTSSRH